MAYQPAYGIIFDKPYNTYFAGDTVTGRVEVIFNKPKEIKGILLQIKGEAKVLWQRTQVRRRGRQRHQEIIDFYNNEEYFKMKFYCFGGNDRDRITLAPGRYTYPFSFILPTNLPSSFEGQYGRIRYTAAMTIERPDRRKIETLVALTVITPYDLNQFPNLAESSKIFAEKHFWCWCCKSGPLTASIMVPKSGFVCGETMLIVVEIDNASNIKVETVNLHFIQYIEYYSSYPSLSTMSETIEIQKIKLGSVDPRDSKSWTQQLLLPPLPPSNLSACSIISSVYRLSLSVAVNSIHSNINATLPITIGTIPIFNAYLNAETFVDIPLPSYETAINSNPGSSNYGWGNNPTSTAPTFSENNLHTEKSIEDCDNDENTEAAAYTPYYPTYKFNDRGNK